MTIELGALYEHKPNHPSAHFKTLSWRRTQDRTQSCYMVPI